MRASRSSQRGVAAALIVIVILLAAAALIASLVLRRTDDQSAQRQRTEQTLANVAAALDGFASGNLRLPCPADPTLDDGIELRTAATCDTPAGTVPWKTIGLSREAAIDSWGRKIAYRVFSGATGLTQDRGATMANCDTKEIFPTGVTGNGLCKPDPPDNNTASRSTTPAEFLAGKGLKLTYFGRNLESPNDHIAFILISHGATGQGAFTTAGQQVLPLPLGDESNNLTSTGPFIAKEFSGPDVPPGAIAFFDDLVAYRTISDLARLANLAPRDWPDDMSITASATFDRPTLTAALNQSPATDTGRSTIVFNSVTVTALDASGNAQNISFNEASPNAGIGGVAGGDDVASTAGGPGEGLRVDFNDPARQFAFALQDFGYDSVFGVPYRFELVQVSFYSVVGSAATLRAQVTKPGCNPDGSLATFSIDAGVGNEFNRVEIRPFPTATVFTARASSFLLSEVRACVAGVTCQTALEATNPSSVCS
jgi:type II secretory pathway pseudopilin PulG